MNVLLFAPPLALLMLLAATTRRCLASAALAVGLQAVVGAPFLAAHPRAYLSRAFELGRAFDRTWSVNLQFLSPAAFSSRLTSAGLLGAHLSLLLLFAHFRWLRASGGLPSLLNASLRRLTRGEPALRPLSARFVASVLFEGNFIGIATARSLHFQFYAWYALTLPFLAWRSALPVWAKLCVLATIERCWNVFPPTPGAAAALTASHAVLVVALLAAPMEAPEQKHKKRHHKH